MRKITKLLTLALAALMIMGATVSAAFTDVSVEDVALTEAVELLSTLGVAKGTSETTFGPDELVTRQQMAAFVYRLMKAGRSSEGGANTTEFVDLEDSTFFSMISWANNAGIIKGRTATEFDPKGNIVLQDAYVMLVRALGYEKDEALAYPHDYIDTAEAIGLDENIPSTVDYTDKLTRGQVAILLANAFYADMNEIVVDYDWIAGPNGNYSYSPVEKQQTVANKIFGVVEETFVVSATEHYGYGQSPLYAETNDIALIGGTRYADDKTVVNGNYEEFKMSELGLEGSSDDYFLAEITLFVKKDAKDADKDQVLAAKSNLVKKTVTAKDVNFELSAKTEAEYYVNADNSATGKKVMTGFATLGGIKAWLAADVAPYSYKKLDVVNTTNDKAAVKFIDLTGGTYDEENATFTFADVQSSSFEGAWASNAQTAYDGISTRFEQLFGVVYNNGLYEADVYDVNGDGYAEYIFVKNYDFVQIIDKKNTAFNNIQTVNGVKTIYTKDATIDGEYKSEDFILAYVNNTAKYVKVAETIAPVEAIVSSKTSNAASETITLKSGEVLEFVDLEKKVQGVYNNATAVDNKYAALTPGQSYTMYIKDGMLLSDSAVSGTGEYDATTSYAIIRTWLDNQQQPNIVRTAEGVVDGKFQTTLYVDVLVDGAVKTVKLAEYAYVNGTRTLIDTRALAETVLSTSFLNQFVTFTVDSNDAYTFKTVNFTAYNAQANPAQFADTENETAIFVTPGADIFMKHYTGSIYEIASSATGTAPNYTAISGNVAGLTKINVKDYSKLIIESVDTEGKAVFTVYSASDLPKFDITKFENSYMVLINNKKSDVENLGILYAYVADFGAKETKDYRIVVGQTQVADEDGQVKTLFTILNPVDGKTTGNIEAAGNASINNDKYVILDAKGEISELSTPAAVGNVTGSYTENVLFGNGFAAYDEENKWLDIDGDNYTYVLDDNTTILYYTNSGKYQMAETDILTETENVYEGLDVQNLQLKVELVAEDTEDNANIKLVKMIIVKKI